MYLSKVGSGLTVGIQKAGFIQHGYCDTASMSKTQSNADGAEPNGAVPAAGAEWYLAREGQQYGPVTEAELTKLVELGHLKDGDLVWRTGFADWQPLATVRSTLTLTPSAMEAIGNAAASASQRPEDDRRSRDRAGSAVAANETPQHVARPSNQNADANAGASTQTGRQAAEQNWQARLVALANRDATSPAPDDRSRPAVGEHGQSRADVAATNATATPQASGTLPGSQQQTDPRLQQARLPDPRQSELRQPGARQHDPRQSDPRQSNPHMNDLRGGDPRFAPGRGGTPLVADRPSHEARGQPKATEAHRARKAPPPASDFDEPDPPRRRFGFLRVLVGIVILAAVGVGTGYAYMHRDMILDMLDSKVTEAAGDNQRLASRTDQRAVLEKQTSDPIGARIARSEPAATTDAKVRAPLAPSTPGQQIETTAALQPASTAAGSVASRGLMATPLWNTINAQYPEWANARVADMQRLREQRVPDDTIDGKLMEAIVELRRQNSGDALAAPESLVIDMATAFLANLKALRSKSVDACYGFISRGETSPAVLSMIGRDATVTKPILSQLSTIMAAIDAGRKQPVAYVQPFGSDYTALSDELIKRGWSRADLELFSNPQSLSRATPEQVCRLVTGWFEAQLGITKKDVQLRLLRQSLRPVVSG